MEHITKEHVRSAIDRFLESRVQRDGEKIFKALSKLDAENDAAKISELNESLMPIREKYHLENWMPKAVTMAGQLRFGTHMSKGVHPDSKGDNINFKSGAQLPDGLVGSQSSVDMALDANRNAGALPLASLFETTVCEENGIKLRDLIVERHPALGGAFSNSPAQSQACLEAFQVALDAAITQPMTYELNKQLLWPCDNSISEDNYINLVPLYPTALASTFYQKVNGEGRFSEANKAAKDSRKKSDIKDHIPYISMPDLAYVKLGGTNSQNVGRLNSRQGGRHMLLPSTPPQFVSNERYRLKQDQETLFTKRLQRCTYQGLTQLYEVVEAVKNVVEVRDARKQALDQILAGLLYWAQQIQQNYPPGWSKDYRLAWAEKCWLDPHRASLENEQEFAERRNSSDWREEIVRRFALWLNDTCLKKRFPDLASRFGEDQYNEWQREIENGIKQSLRSGKGVFA